MNWVSICGDTAEGAEAFRQEPFFTKLRSSEQEKAALGPSKSQPVFTRGCRTWLDGRVRKQAGTSHATRSKL